MRNFVVEIPGNILQFQVNENLKNYSEFIKQLELFYQNAQEFEFIYKDQDGDIISVNCQQDFEAVMLQLEEKNQLKLTATQTHKALQIQNSQNDIEIQKASTQLDLNDVVLLLKKMLLNPLINESFQREVQEIFKKKYQSQSLSKQTMQCEININQFFFMLNELIQTSFKYPNPSIKSQQNNDSQAKDNQHNKDKVSLNSIKTLRDNQDFSQKIESYSQIQKSEELIHSQQDNSGKITNQMQKLQADQYFQASFVESIYEIFNENESKLNQ